MSWQKPHEYHIEFSYMDAIDKAWTDQLDVKDIRLGEATLDPPCPDDYKPFQSPFEGLEITLPCTIVSYGDPLKLATLFAKGAYPATIKRWRSVRRDERRAKMEREKHQRILNTMRIERIAEQRWS